MLSSGGTIDLVSNYPLSTTETRFVAYFWLDDSLVDENIMGTLSANITAEMERVKGSFS